MSLDRTRAPEPASIRTFVFPQVRHEQIDNGITLLSARHGDLPVAERGFQIFQGGEQAVGGLQEDQGIRQAGHACEQAAPLGCSARQVSQV